METIAEFRFVYKEAIIEIGDTSAKKLHKCSCQGGGHVLIFALLCVDREVSFV